MTRPKIPGGMSDLIGRTAEAIRVVEYLMENDQHDGENYAPVLLRLKSEHAELQRAIA